MRTWVLLPLLLVSCSDADAETPATETDAASEAAEPADASSDGLADSPVTPDTAADAFVPPDTAGPATVPYVYLGCGNGDIEQYTWDAAAGVLAFKAKFAGGNNPSFLAVDPSRRFLYAVNEGSSQVAAFSIAKDTGALTLLNRVSSEGSGPAFVSVDGSGKYVLVANYGGGTVAVFPIGSDGKLGAKVSGDSPGPKAHSILTDPSNRFAYVPTLGADAVFQYAFDPTKGSLTALSPNKIASAGGAGPRHIAFAPSGAFAYVANELNDTVTAYAIDATKGTLSSLQSLSSLPSGFDPSKNSGADVHVRPDGKTLYASNRGHNSIAIFAIGADGKLGAPKHEPTGGGTPRNFHVDPSGNTLLVANQASGNVVTFAIDGTGGLTKLKTNPTCSAPAYVGVVLVPKG